MRSISNPEPDEPISCAGKAVRGPGPDYSACSSYCIAPAMLPSVSWKKKRVPTELEVLPAVPLQLPMPRDARAARLARRLLANPGDDAALTRLVRSAGGSRRTLERLFALEVGMPLGRWRQRMRLLHALRCLAGGESVTAVAAQVGYASASAFVAMFRRELGVTPSRYFERSTG